MRGAVEIKTEADGGGSNVVMIKCAGDGDGECIRFI